MSAPIRPTPFPPKGIIWLASYPKSGNTWFRLFLQALLTPEAAELDPDRVKFEIASSRAIIDDYSCIDSSDLSHDETDALRPGSYEQMLRESPTPRLFLKVHDAYQRLSNGRSLFPTAATAGVLYLVRNPLDVAVSFAYHSGHSGFDRSIKLLADDAYATAAGVNHLNAQLRQVMLSWSGHVASWLDQPKVPVHLIRYEDMCAEPQRTFSAAVRGAGLDFDENDVAVALEKCRFEKLRDWEKQNLFREKAPNCEHFFRSGRAGSWREALTPTQADAIVERHREMMRRLGYLTSSGEPVY